MLKLQKIKILEENDFNQDLNIKYLISRMKSFLKGQFQKFLNGKFQIHDHEFWTENLQFIFGILMFRYILQI